MATYAESVWQHSPGLADCVGQPWERVSLHSANSERVEQGVGRNAGINPDAFHATSGIDLLTEHLSGFLPSIWASYPGLPDCVGQPWAALPNPCGVSKRIAPSIVECQPSFRR